MLAKIGIPEAASNRCFLFVGQLVVALDYVQAENGFELRHGRDVKLYSFCFCYSNIQNRYDCRSLPFLVFTRRKNGHWLDLLKTSSDIPDSPRLHGGAMGANILKPTRLGVFLVYFSPGERTGIESTFFVLVPPASTRPRHGCAVCTNTGGCSKA